MATFKDGGKNPWVKQAQEAMAKALDAKAPATVQRAHFGKPILDSFLSSKGRNAGKRKTVLKFPLIGGNPMYSRSYDATDLELIGRLTEKERTQIIEALKLANKDLK